MELSDPEGSDEWIIVKPQTASSPSSIVFALAWTEADAVTTSSRRWAAAFITAVPLLVALCARDTLWTVWWREPAPRSMQPASSRPARSRPLGEDPRRVLP